jgi:hypothetical protein
VYLLTFRIDCVNRSLNRFPLLPTYFHFPLLAIARYLKRKTFPAPPRVNHNVGLPEMVVDRTHHRLSWLHSWKHYEKPIVIIHAFTTITHPKHVDQQAIPDDPVFPDRTASKSLDMNSRLPCTAVRNLASGTNPASRFHSSAHSNARRPFASVRHETFDRLHATASKSTGETGSLDGRHKRGSARSCQPRSTLWVADWDFRRLPHSSQLVGLPSLSISSIARRK